MPETNFLQFWAVNYPLSKMMLDAGMLQALLFWQQLTIPLQTSAVPASVSLGQGQQHPAPTRADISIAHPECQNPPGINNNTCHAPWYCHRNARLPRRRLQWDRRERCRGLCSCIKHMEDCSSCLVRVTRGAIGASSDPLLPHCLLPWQTCPGWVALESGEDGREGESLGSARHSHRP